MPPSPTRKRVASPHLGQRAVYDVPSAERYTFTYAFAHRYHTPNQGRPEPSSPDWSSKSKRRADPSEGASPAPDPDPAVPCCKGASATLFPSAKSLPDLNLRPFSADIQTECVHASQLCNLGGSCRGLVEVLSLPSPPFRQAVPERGTIPTAHRGALHLEPLTFPRFVVQFRVCEGISCRTHRSAFQ